MSEFEGVVKKQTPTFVCDLSNGVIDPIPLGTLDISDVVPKGRQTVVDSKISV